jgi:signal transduction histidine kinase
VEVVDNGVGIPSTHLPHVFKRFYRVERSHSQNQVKGTGLGLSIVKRAVEAHRGSVAVVSRPGQETIFRITVPKTGVHSLQA